MNYRLFEVLNHLAGRLDALDDVMEFTATWVIYAVFAVAAELVSMRLYRRQLRPVLQFGVALALAFVTAMLVAHQSHQLRPFQTHHVHQLLAHDPGVSMPSDHATAAFTMAFGTAVFLHRRWGIVLTAAATLIGTARIWAGLHYPGDIVAAAMIAGLSVLAVALGSRWRTSTNAALIAVTAWAMTGCGHAASETRPAATAAAPAGAANSARAAPDRPGGYSKVLLIAEENHSYDRIIGSPDAAYLNTLAARYGTATRLDAGYPTRCPSLAAYILLTSGTTAGICDDRAPKAHRLPGDNLFHQVAASGREWRNYAESAPTPCAQTNSPDGRYLVRHVPATYYLSERTGCATRAVPMGTPDGGALHDDVTHGTLPSFAFISPDACHDMHGATPCPNNRVSEGDRWLATWIPKILTAPDYRKGRLAIIITFDEGTATDNHIPTLVISPTTTGIATNTAFTHCSTLRTIEEILHLPLLGCAAHATTMTTAFHL